MSKKKKVLVVEDDDDSRLALTSMLEALGHEIIAYSNAKEVLQNISNIDSDIVLLDIMMPQMNGVELLKELRLNQKFKNTPMIMVTAKDQDNDVLQGYQEGADYYITKPFTTKQLEYGIKLFFQSENE